jgi:Tfp pilus assembly protein PilN
VRAFNLIPSEQRRGAGGITGRTGGIAYVITGGLLVLVALGVIYAFSVRDIASDKTTLAEVNAQVADVNLQAQALAPYTEFATIANTRIANVAQLAEQRFDWPLAMQQLALALPADVTLTSLTATTNSSVPTNALTPAAGTTTATVAVAPTFTLVGCATSQDEVANVLTRLRELKDVAGATLQSSQDTGAAISKHAKNGDLAISGTCPADTFNMTITYNTGYGIPSGSLRKAPGAAVETSIGGANGSAVQTAAAASGAN